MCHRGHNSCGLGLHPEQAEGSNHQHDADLHLQTQEEEECRRPAPKSLKTWGQAMCERFRFIERRPWESRCVTFGKVKPKLQWGCLDVRDASKTGHLPKNLNQERSYVLQAREPEGQGYLWPLSWATDFKHRARVFGLVCPDEFLFCFDQIFLLLFFIPLLWNEKVYFIQLNIIEWLPIMFQYFIGAYI